MTRANDASEKRQDNQSPVLGRKIENALRQLARAGCKLAVEAGMPPGAVGYRHVRTDTARSLVASFQARGGSGVDWQLVHPRTRADNPLPLNVDGRGALPDDAGWWGYSMHDVPERLSDETWIATIPDGRVVTTLDHRGKFYPAILSKDGRAINLREIVFRNMHAELLRSDPPIKRLTRATWICERVYDNYSHWLTAHLPKLRLLHNRGMLGGVLLPEELPPVMEQSIRLMGLNPDDFETFKAGEVIEADELTILGTDRFRSELLQPVRTALAPPNNWPATRRIFISRSKAPIRRLANEDSIFPFFAEAGFDRVYMEDLDFSAQVQLMRETAILAAPHGAGLTNMMFCPEGSKVIEIAWPGFPNPNFYALACAMGLNYAIVAAEPFGQAEMLLERDMIVDENAVRQALALVAAPTAQPIVHKR